MVADPILAGLLSDVDVANAETRAAVERQHVASLALARYLAACAAPPGIIVDGLPEWPTYPGHPDLMSTADAAKRAGVSSDTIVRWCRSQGIGKTYGKRWWISQRRLSRIIEKTSN